MVFHSRETILDIRYGLEIFSEIMKGLQQV
jgi:hypothetical protein